MRLKRCLATLMACLCLAGCSLLSAQAPRPAPSHLADRYLADPADLLELGEVVLHVRTGGPVNAPAIVMIHGFGSSLHSWEPWAEALGNDFRTIRFDLPGSGLSPPDPSGLYTDARALDLMIALMDHLRVERATIIGHSMGGRIAWTFAGAHPERVDRLVLVSPDGFQSPFFAYGKRARVPFIFTLVQYYLPRSLVRSMLASSFGDDARLSPQTVERYHNLITAPGARKAMLARMRQTVLVDPVPILETIRVPVLLVWGEKDRVIPFRNAQDYLRALPDARLLAYADLGHIPQEEAGASALADVLPFLTGEEHDHD